MAPRCLDAVGQGAGMAEGSRRLQAACRARLWLCPDCHCRVPVAEEVVWWQGTRLLCKHSRASQSGAPRGDDEPEHDARCGATLSDAPAPPSWCQVLCGSRCGRTDAALDLLKQRKPSLPRTTGDQRELLPDSLGTAEGCWVQSESK